MRAVLLLCLGLPAALGVLAYAWLAFDHRTLWLWEVVVHESGRYTLGETVLYFNHALRELPILLAMAGFAGAGYAKALGPSPLTPAGQRKAKRVAGATLGAGLAVVVLVGAGAVAQQGLEVALGDLLQFHTRDGVAAYGSHWRYHLLSTVWFGVAASLAAPLVAGGVASGRPAWAPWLYVAILTALFGVSSEVFFDVRYAGHQAREILTHGLVTLPLVLGVLALTEAALGGPHAAARKASARGRGFWFWLVVFLIIPAHLGAVSLAGDVQAAGQFERGWAAVVAAHLFEHTLDYGLVTLLAAGLYSALRAK